MDDVQLNPERKERFFMNVKYKSNDEEFFLETTGWECFTVNGFRFWARDITPFEVVVSDALTGHKVAQGVWPDAIYEAKKKVEKNYDKYLVKAKAILRKRRFRPKAIESTE